MPEVRIANLEGPGELIMFVDDDDYMRALTELVLTAEGYRVVLARSGFEAMELMGRLGENVALVILDYVMPVMNGSQVLAALRRIVPEMPVIITSGFTEDSGLRELLEREKCGFIPKPLARNKILHGINAALDDIRVRCNPVSAQA